MPRGDYRATCDYCGITWHRSRLRKDASGLLACPDEGNGRDMVTLADANANAAGKRPISERKSDGRYDDGVSAGEDDAVQRTTGEDIYA